MWFRFATLAVALLAAAPGIAQKPAATSGDEEAPTTIDADVIEGVSDLEVTARGNAEIRRGDVSIFADRLRYNREFGRAEADGGVRMQSGADRFFGPSLQYNTHDDTGVLEQPGFLIEREQTSRGTAERLEFLGKHKYRLTNASYTTCRPGQDDWRLEAAQMDLDYETEEGYARSPRLRFFGIPVLGAPIAGFPLTDRRRSGVLTPYYSQTTTRGLEVGLPYYWNIAPERDATITPVFMAKRGVQLKNEFRYLERRYGGELKLEYMPEDRLFGEDRAGVSFQHTQRLGSGLSAHVDYNKVSDDRYFVDLASQVRQVSIGNLQQDGYVAYSGTWGRAPVSAQARVQRFQTLQDPLAPIVPPYHRVPQLNFNGAYTELGGILDMAAPAEFVRFSHDSMVEGARTSFNPVIAAPLLGAGWHVTPKLGLRNVNYNLTQAAPDQPLSPNVTIPWFSVDTGVVLERDWRFSGQSVTQTLEPRLFYVRVPYRDQDRIPIFDTTLADFNYAQLFTENRFVGGDRFGDANQATLAFTSRFLQANGQEVLRATIGQRYYFEDERVGLTPTSALRSNTDSDVLASLGGRLWGAWTFDTTTQYNRLEQRAERYTIATRYAPAAAKVLNLSYRYIRETVRQIDVSAQWPVATGWYAVGRYNYSFLDDRPLEGLAGFEYNAGCWVFRAVVQRVQAAAQVSTTGLFFQIEFNGLGRLGTDDPVELLRRSVPGYSVTNPRDASLAPEDVRPRLPFEQVY
jgi:LPS-assembly protein